MFVPALQLSALNKTIVVTVSVVTFVTVAASFGLAFEPSAVNGVNYDEKSTPTGSGSKEPDAVVLKLQIMLDRAHFSPGLIDGRMGDNTVYALREFEKRSGLPADGRLDQKVWNALTRGTPKVLITYTLTEEDTKGPFAENVPDDYAAMAEMESLSYTSVQELLSEKFHIDIELLKSLNPGAQFERGEEITVPDVADAVIEGVVKRIEIDKARASCAATARMASFSWCTPPPSGVTTIQVPLERCR
jgi:Putative peptidoglycan binding domain